MNIYFLPTSSKILPTFRHFAQLGSILHSWKFILPAFKFRPGKGVFWGGFWGVLCTYISLKGVFDCGVTNMGTGLDREGGWWGTRRTMKGLGKGGTAGGAVLVNWPSCSSESLN